MEARGRLHIIDIPEALDGRNQAPSTQRQTIAIPET